VAFEEDQRFPVDEEGNFTRWLRHGLQVAREIENWLLIYPEMDEPVLDIWINSLRTTAQTGFKMALGEPSRLMCSDPRVELPELLQRHVIIGQTQFVLLMTPSNDSWKVYRLFKEWTCCQLPVPSQVIKSDTIRKRQSTGMILARIVQQMNAKSWGPLWHILPEEKETPAFEEFYRHPVMMLGINIYQTSGGHRWMGLVASLNKVCSQFYSGAKECTDSASLSVNLQNLFRDALVDFADNNEKQVPQHLVIYRGFVEEEDYPSLEVELQSLQAVLKLAAKQTREDYAPEMTYIAVAKQDDMRIFSLRPDVANIANPESGTVVDDPKICFGSFPSFYAINQSTTKGTAVPAHFSVLKKPENMSMDFIHSLTYRLSLLYYNSNAAIRLPAPLMYAHRLAKFAGTVLRREPSNDLRLTLYYL